MKKLSCLMICGLVLVNCGPDNFMLVAEESVEASIAFQEYIYLAEVVILAQNMNLVLNETFPPGELIYGAYLRGAEETLASLECAYLNLPIREVRLAIDEPLEPPLAPDEDHLLCQLPDDWPDQQVINLE